MNNIPNANNIYASEYKTSCFIKNVVTAPNVIIGAYTYYDDGSAPLEFEKNNILFNYPELGDRLMIGKFCAIASGTKFIMKRRQSSAAQRYHLSVSCAGRFVARKNSQSSF